jgi:hypothetical protein
MMNTTQSSWRKHKSIPITLSEPLEHSRSIIHYKLHVSNRRSSHAYLILFVQLSNWDPVLEILVV